MTLTMTRTQSRFWFTELFVFPYILLLASQQLPVSLLPQTAINNNKIFRVVEAAHPRRRVTTRRETAAYDREITTFTEDGRLAQVEYGLEASLRGSTVAAIKVRLRNDDDDGYGNDSSCIVVCIENSSFGKMHRIDDHIWMLTAGLSGDARMLANQVRRSCQNHRLRYGEGPTTKQAARFTAEFYHQLTRMGGCRPLGCTAILMGVENDNGNANYNHNHNNIPDDSSSSSLAAAVKLFRTDPGGGYDECSFCAAGNLRDMVGKELMGLVESFDGDDNDREKNHEGHQASEKEAGNRERTSMKRFASIMAGKVVRLLDRNGKTKKGRADELGPTLDVWTIQPMEGRRGGMLATCYSDVRKDNVENIML